ncbi:MAG: anhydro-N-acetylmuramic acid kinase [Elusimicrobia bacterium]|nr:anhydro-N-acetylmuramic acid kinase [Elusimicrobiota bacterium]
MGTDLALGLMSGTSADGVTAVLVRSARTSLKVLSLRNYPYPKGLRDRVLEARFLTAARLSELNFELGEFFARCAVKTLGRRRVRVIGSHGQTVWHGPEGRFPNTLQLGEPCVIAERTGAAVVADFRTREMAAGGQGAPLVPAFDEFIFARGPLRAVINIGGIANASLVGRGRLWNAFDTGPGNGPLDLAVRQATRGRLAFDRNGGLALKGRADDRLVRRLLSDPFLRRRPPKSLDKSYFGELFLRRHFGKPSLARLPDVLATLSRFVARSIADSCRRFAPGTVHEAVISGGGAFNRALRRELESAFSPIPLSSSDRFGLPVMAKEAACFAWLALRAIQGRPNNCPAATGSRGRRVLGKIAPGEA